MRSDNQIVKQSTLSLLPHIIQLGFKMEFKLKKELKLNEQIFDARYHPKHENNLIGVATISGNVHLIENNEIKTKIRKHHKGSSIRKIRFDKNGHNLITIAKTVKIYDLATSQTTHTLSRSDEDKLATLYSVMPLDDGGKLIAAGDDDGSLYVWDTRVSENGDKPIFKSSDCEQYISDIDGKYEPKRLIVCTSGEGTLTAYDLRANKMIEPQSELFEAGFQCVKMVDLNKKVVIGGEDGAVYVFNYNEWAHTSGKFPIDDDTRNRGKCSLEGIELLPDSSVFVAACSDGRLRSFSLWPHENLNSMVVCRRSPLESIHVNPNEDISELVVCGDNYLNMIGFERKDSDDDDDDGDGKKKNDDRDSSDDDDSSSGESTSSGANNDDAARDESSAKKLKTNTEDYLNLFS